MAKNSNPLPKPKRGRPPKKQPPAKGTSVSPVTKPRGRPPKAASNKKSATPKPKPKPKAKKAPAAGTSSAQKRGRTDKEDDVMQNEDVSKQKRFSNNTFATRIPPESFPAPTHPEPEKAPALFRSTMEPILKIVSDREFSVSTQGEACPLSTPGLMIKGCEVTSPLTEESAAVLREHGKTSPFGHGLETKVDTNVRNSLEFDAEDVTFKNPLWNKSVRKIAEKACQDLGLSNKRIERVRCSLWKALYYPTGSFFKPHQDTEKEPGMFATLVVCLPSTFTGGELAVTHLKESRVHTFGDPQRRSTYAHYVCFFADVMHEVLPVTSGDRVVLTYNLVWQSGPDSVPSLDFQHRFAKPIHGMKDALSSHFTPAAHPAFFGLEHEYTDMTLSSHGASCLKGRDKIVHSILKLSAKGSGALFAFGRRDKNVTFGGMEGEDYRIHWEVIESERPTTQWFGTDPTIIACCNKQVVSSKNIMLLPGLEKEWPKHWADHEEDYGYMGNEGATRNTIYHAWVMAIIPFNLVKPYLEHADPLSLLSEDELPFDIHHEPSREVVLKNFGDLCAQHVGSGKFDNNASFQKCISRVDRLGVPPSRCTSNDEADAT